MAKALVGYIGGIDPRKAREAGQLRQRIVDLESEVRRLKAENDALAAAYRRSGEECSELVEIIEREPAARVLQPAVS